MSIKETEKQMSDIVQLLHDANKPAETLAVQFGQMAQGGKGMEIIMRFLSGTGAWRFLNKVKAAGMTITTIFDNITETNKAHYESIQIISDEVNTLAGLAKLRKEEVDTNNSVYEGLRLIHGEEKARAKTREYLNDAYDEQNKKVQQLREMQMSDKDVIAKIKAEKKTIKNTEKALAKAKEMFKVKKEIVEVNKIFAEDAEKRLSVGMTITQIEKDSIEAYHKSTEELEKQRDIVNDLLKPQRELKAASKIGAERGITSKAGREFGPITKLFMKPIKKIQKYVKMTSSFISNISKLVWSVFKLAMKAMIMGMLYLALIVTGFILLKPIIVKLWDTFKKSSGQFSVLKENFASFMETWNTTLKPLFMTAWESAKGFFAVLSDPNATISDALSAGATMVMDLGMALFATGKAWFNEMIIPLLKILYNMAIELWAEFKTWVSDTLFPYLYENVPLWLAIIEQKLIWLKDYLAENVPIWIGAIWDWIINTGLPAFAEGMYNLAGWLMDSFFPALEKVLVWIWEIGLPKLGDKFAQLVEWFVMDFGGWVVETLPGILTKAIGELGDAILPDVDLKGEGIPFIPGIATGGIITSGGLAVVGEDGPELVKLPTAATVTPNHALGNSNVINVHVNGRVGASDSELRDIARKVGAMINREINRTTNAGVRL